MKDHFQLFTDLNWDVSGVKVGGEWWDSAGDCIFFIFRQRLSWGPCCSRGREQATGSLACSLPEGGTSPIHSLWELKVGMCQRSGWRGGLECFTYPLGGVCRGHAQSSALLSALQSGGWVSQSLYLLFRDCLLTVHAHQRDWINLREGSQV